MKSVLIIAALLLAATGALADHDPISINTDLNFTLPNGVSSGTGADNDPWIIEGYNITAFATEPCIEIMNTDEFVIIKDCRVYGDSSIFIEITNCSNVRFFNVLIEGDPDNAFQDGVILFALLLSLKNCFLKNGNIAFFYMTL